MLLGGFWCYVGLVLLVCIYVCVFDLWLVVLDMIGCLLGLGYWFVGLLVVGVLFRLTR